MKKAIVLVIVCATVVGGAWLARRDLAFGQAAETKETKDQGITKTKAEWEKLVQDRVALALKEKARRIHDAENWDTAIFNGVEYTVYTGPGQVMAVRPVQQKTPPKTGPRPTTGMTPAK